MIKAIELTEDLLSEIGIDLYEEEVESMRDRHIKELDVEMLMGFIEDPESEELKNSVVEVDTYRSMKELTKEIKRTIEENFYELDMSNETIYHFCVEDGKQFVHKTIGHRPKIEYKERIYQL